MSSCFRLVVLAFTLLLVAGGAQAQALRTSDRGTVRVLDRSETGIVFEVVAEWDTPLAEAVRARAPLAVLALRAVNGDGLASEVIELPALDAPSVDILASDFDEVAFRPMADDETVATYVGPAAEVRGLGLERRTPKGNFVGRLLQYDPERQVLRRYRRIVAAVRYSAARPSSAALLRGGGENPHLEVGQSVLASGTWFKVPVTEEGIYRIDRSFLSELGLSPESIDPNNVVVYGNGGAPLPALNSAPRIADLAENATLVLGGGDGAFGDGDAVYFYGSAPSGWTWDQSEANAGRTGWRHFINVFSDVNYYFVRIDGEASDRIGGATFANLPSAQALTSVRGRVFVEEDRPNGMIDRDGGGSGLDWLGDEVSASNPSIVVLDTIPAGFSGGAVEYRARVATRSSSLITLALVSQGQEVGTPVRFSSGGQLARDRIISGEATSSDGRLQVSLSVSGTSSNRQGWIDYVEAFYDKPLRATDDYLRFYTPGGETGAFEFTLAGFSSEPQVWDITEPDAIRRIGTQASGSGWRVQVEASDAEQVRELVAFVPSSPTVRRPSSGTRVENQNLHAVAGFPDYVIIVPDAFREAADELAEHRAADGLRPLVVDIDQVFNEFSGGLVDMRAVRDYLRFLYDRTPGDNPALQHALLFGDGHFDFRGIRDGGDQNNWVPTFQSEDSFSRINSYTSDDYFALLDESEGVWNRSDTSERVDIGIGRIPVRTLGEALEMVEKIKRYENPSTQGSWRARYTFVADDQEPNDWDTDLHVQNADLVADSVQVDFPFMNVQKIYSMTYPRVLTALGARYPEAQDDILRSFNEGTLVWNYSGHGGSGGLADERLITKEDIAVLDNADRLAILVTATCSFGRFDVIPDQSGAETFLLNANGGAAGVFTTTRLVYTSNNPEAFNLGLNVALNEFLLSRGDDGRPLRLGDIYRRTKATDAGSQFNNRKFSFLGDPGMRIQLPERTVEITSVNGESIGATEPSLEDLGVVRSVDSATLGTARLQPSVGADLGTVNARPDGRLGLPTLRALEEAEVSGEVIGANGQRDASYNGEVEVSVFDAERRVLLPEDAINYTDGFYEVQNDLIYRGRATVREGAFTARFIVPRDISYSNERGRITAYVSEPSGNDGLGFTEQFVIGGTSDSPIEDNEGPRVDLFMNDTTFVSGGLVGSTPVLVAKLFDQNGINTVGTGVGHELLLTIDGEEQDATDLSRFYRGDLDSFRRGQVTYELPEQEPGPHTLSLRAWDVANNATTATLDYYVEPDGELVLRNVYNYPNPTTGPTRFVFEHNQPPGTVARVQVRIYTLSGRPVRTIDSVEALPEGALIGSLVQVAWDGRDEDFDRLATGIYLYKVRVEVEREGGETQVSERIERLAVIR